MIRVRIHPLTAHAFATLLLCRDATTEKPLALDQTVSIVGLHRRRLVAFRPWSRTLGNGGYYITAAGLTELGHRQSDAA